MRKKFNNQQTAQVQSIFVKNQIVFISKVRSLFNF